MDFVPVLEADFTVPLFAGDFLEDTLVAAAFAGAAFADLDADAFFWVSVVFWAAGAGWAVAAAANAAITAARNRKLVIVLVTVL